MKIRIHPSFLLYLSSMALFASGWSCLGAVCALFVHEASHLVASRMAGEEIEAIELTPFGGVITYAPGRCPRKGIWGLVVAAAGPFGNYLTMYVVSLGGISCMLPSQAVSQVLLANAAMMLINLLPALPLDGGRMVFSVGYYVFGVSGLITVLTALGMITGAAFALMGVYGVAALGTLNLSALIVGGYLMICAARCRTIMLSENMLALVQERQGRRVRTVRASIYAVAGDAPLFTLIEPIERSAAAIFCIADGGSAPRFVGERAVLDALLATPHACIRDIVGISHAEKGENPINRP